MQILKNPTYWTAEQADGIYEFLGDLRVAIWEQYGGEIDQLYDELRKQAGIKRSPVENEGKKT